MGSWNATCAVSHLPVTVYDPVRLIMLVEMPRASVTGCKPSGLLHPNDGWTPISLPMKGTYDDYGAVELSDPDDWRASLFIETLKSVTVPVEQGAHRIHHLRCYPEDLTDMDAIQNLCQSGDGRLFIQPMRPTDEPQSVGFMMVREDVYSAMTEKMPILCEKDQTPAELVERAHPMLTALAETASQDTPEQFLARMKVVDEIQTNFSKYPGFVSFSSRDHSLTPPLASMTLSYVFNELVRRVAVEGVESTTAQDMATSLAEMVCFDSAMDRLRRTYGPKISAGEDEDFDLHARIAKIVRDTAAEEIGETC